MRVLVVEDDTALAHEVAHALRAESFAVDIAANGEDGAHLGSTERYDVAVLDLGLPRVDGLTVAASLGDGQNALLQVRLREAGRFADRREIFELNRLG